MGVIWVRLQGKTSEIQNIFLEGDWTGQISLIPFGNFVFRRNAN